MSYERGQMWGRIGRESGVVVRGFADGARGQMNPRDRLWFFAGLVTGCWVTAIIAMVVHYLWVTKGVN